MRIQNLLVSLAVCACATGCSRLHEMAMPVTAKINAAHPVSPEAKLARERLLALLPDDPKAVDTLEAQTESRMALRALSCSKNVSVGRFDTVPAVKAIPMDEPCFQEQDRELQKFYALRIIGALLAKPALRPLKAAGPIATLPKGKLSYIDSGALARDAGVGVLRDGRGEGLVVDMPGGRPIAQLPSNGFADASKTRVSPNGRVVAVAASGRAPEFVEAETGNRIWTATGGSATRLLAWLPEVSGFAMAVSDGNVMLADGVTGSMDVHPLSIRNTSFAAHLPGPPARLLMGTAHELVLVEHTRAAQGILATAIKQYTIRNAPGITSGNPVPMASGHRVVYASMRDIGWLDLDSGASGTWRTAPLFGIPFAKLDESHIMLDSSEPGLTSLKAWSFDIADATVAPIDLAEPHGLIVDIGDRVGFLRRGSDAWFGDTVTTGEAQPLDKVMADYELQQQLAKVKALTGGEEPSGAAIQGIPTGAGAAPLPGTPGLGDLPFDAKVEIVGVYEGKRSTANSTSGHPGREVRVLARASNRPIVLVLASYEPVNWIVVNSGARISAVLLSGYYPSTVSGVGSARVLRIGSAYAYSAGSAAYGSLRQAVSQYTGPREIRSFQGSYTGVEFSVGGN
jgi:hypothetical protein